MSFTRRLFCALGAAPAFARKHIDLDRISAITDEIATTSSDAIAFARRYGLHWVELRRVPGGKEYAFLPEPELLAEARRFKQSGLRVSFLNTSLMKVYIPGIEPVRWARDLADGKTTPEKIEARRAAETIKYERRMDDLAKAIRAAHILGTDKLRVFTGWRAADSAATLPRVAAILNQMAAVAEKEHVQLLIENEVACNVASCSETAALLKLVPSRHVGINWDPYNGSHFQEVPYPDGYRLLPVSRLGNVQIKGRSILPGPERLDWAAIFHGLVADGYKGKFGLETHIRENLIEQSHASMQVILDILKA